MMYQALSHPPALPPHYLDSAEVLLQLQAQGASLAEMARLAGLTVAQVHGRLQLNALDPGMKALLRREGVPEKIALTLLRVTDPLARRRLALRIIRERLCIRDAALLADSAQRRTPLRLEEPHQRVIAVIRDVRPYRNAIRDIAEQMKNAGVRATFNERKTGGMQELTVSYPTRRRRVERFHSI